MIYLKYIMQEQEIKELLKKNLETSERSLEILKKIRREAQYRRIFTAVKWLVIIGLLVWGIIQIQPFIDRFAQTINEFNRLLPGR